jgi:hypothetical protein
MENTESVRKLMSIKKQIKVTAKQRLYSLQTKACPYRMDQLHLQSKTEIIFTSDQDLSIYNGPATFTK